MGGFVLDVKIVKKALKVFSFLWLKLKKMLFLGWQAKDWTYPTGRHLHTGDWGSDILGYFIFFCFCWCWVQPDMLMVSRFWGEVKWKLSRAAAYLVTLFSRHTIQMDGWWSSIFAPKHEKWFRKTHSRGIGQMEINWCGQKSNLFL